MPTRRSSVRVKARVSKTCKMPLIDKIWTICKAQAFYARFFWLDSRRVKKELEAVFANDPLHSIPTGYLKRLHQYGMYALLFSRWFSGLRGHRLSNKEIQAILCFGFCNPLLDDLVDEHDISLERLLALRDDPAISSRHEFEHFLGKAFTRLRQLKAGSMESFDHRLGPLLAAQVRSKEQTRQISLAEIEKITCDKGGYALLLLRSLLDPPLIENEEELVYSVGAMIQFINDVFDFHKDYRSGISTMATHIGDPGGIRACFDEFAGKVHGSLSALGAAKGDKRFFLFHFAMIAGRGEICLEQFARTKREKGCFDPRQLERSYFICDMHKAENVLKLARYCLAEGL